MAKADNRLYVNYVDLGRHIREARKANTITQEMLAERMNISIGHLGKIERGERMINLERLAEISVLLKTPIEKMITGCVTDEPGHTAPETVTENDLGAVFETLLKGRSQKTIDLILTVASDIVRSIEG